MVTEEDMAVTQAKLVELSEENFALQSALEAAQEQARALPQVRSRLAAAQRALAADARSYEKEEESLRSQFSPGGGLTHRIKHFGARSPPRAAIEVDESALTSAKEHLADDTERLSTLIEDGTELMERAALLEARIGALRAGSARLKARIADCEVYGPQVHSAFGVGMLVQDLVARLDQARAARAWQRGRRNRLVNWIGQTEAVRGHQESALVSLRAQLCEISEKISQKSGELAEVQERLGRATQEHAEMASRVAAAESERDQVREDIRANTRRFDSDREQKEAEMRNIDRFTETLRHDLLTHDVSKRTQLQKRLDMVQQLSKRLSSERQNLQSVEVDPAVIEELTQNVTTALTEKQEAADELKRAEDQLKWLQSESRKKSMMIEELKQMIIPKSGDDRSITAVLKDFQRLLDDTEVQHECFFENLQIVSFEAEGLEDERTSLLTFLRA
jgi:DNA repair exonuclease SbcCD ATPase subunit